MYEAVIAIHHGGQRIRPGEPIPDSVEPELIEDWLNGGAVRRAPKGRRAKKPLSVDADALVMTAELTIS